jgi:mitogen-activated protein kinase kinase 7
LALDQSTSFGLGGSSSSSSPLMSRHRRQAPPPGGSGNLNLNGPPLSRAGLKFPGAFPPQPSQDEYERKLEDIMKLTGVLNIDGKRYPTPIGDLEALGDLGNGTCGHVVKMRHKESGKIIACKQMRRTGNSEETKRIVMDMDVVSMNRDEAPYKGIVFALVFSHIRCGV